MMQSTTNFASNSPIFPCHLGKPDFSYLRWKSDVDNQLIHLMAHDIALGTYPRPAAGVRVKLIDDWVLNNARGYSFLRACLTPSTIFLLDGVPLGDCHAAYTAITNGLKRQTTMSKSSILSKFSHVRQLPDEDILSYLSRVEYIWKEANEIHNLAITEEIARNQALMGLSSRFSNIKLILENSTDLSLRYLKTTLLDHEERLNLTLEPSDAILNKISTNQNQPAALSALALPDLESKINALVSRAIYKFKAKPKSLFCNYCKKPGHVIADCRKRARSLKNRSQQQFNELPSSNPPSDHPTSNKSNYKSNDHHRHHHSNKKPRKEYASVAQSATDQQVDYDFSTQQFGPEYSSDNSGDGPTSLILDSGASSTIISRKLMKYVTDITTLHYPVPIITAAGTIYATSSANLRLELPNQPTFILHNVLISPTIKFNLLSIHQLCTYNFSINIQYCCRCTRECYWS